MMQPAFQQQWTIGHPLPLQVVQPWASGQMPPQQHGWQTQQPMMPPMQVPVPMPMMDTAPRPPLQMPMAQPMQQPMPTAANSEAEQAVPRFGDDAGKLSTAFKTLGMAWWTGSSAQMH